MLKVGSLTLNIPLQFPKTEELILLGGNQN